MNTFYKNYICKEIKKEDYEDEWDYDRTIRESYIDNMMDEIYVKLCSMETNENISNFIFEYKSKKNKSNLR